MPRCYCPPLPLHRHADTATPMLPGCRRHTAAAATLPLRPHCRVAGGCTGAALGTSWVVGGAGWVGVRLTVGLRVWAALRVGHRPPSPRRSAVWWRGVAPAPPLGSWGFLWVLYRVLWVLYGFEWVVVWLLYGCCMVVVWLLYGCCIGLERIIKSAGLRYPSMKSNPTPERPRTGAASTLMPPRSDIAATMGESRIHGGLATRAEVRGLSRTRGARAAGSRVMSRIGFCGLKKD